MSKFIRMLALGLSIAIMVFSAAALVAQLGVIVVNQMSIILR